MKKYAIGQQLAKYGRGQDSMLAHITPYEASLLKKMGGSGKRNPVTGLLEFERGSSSGEGAGAGGGRGGEGAGGGGNDPFGAEGFGGMGAPFGGMSAATGATPVDPGPMDLSNEAGRGHAGLGIGLGPSMSAQAAVDATTTNVTPTMAQMPGIIEAGKINQTNRPGFGNVVQGLAGLAAPGFGLAAGALGMANNAGLSFDGPSPGGTGTVGGDAAGGGGAGPNEGGGREGPNDYGLLSPRPAGGLADATPDPGLAGFTYTNPLTGQVEVYQGGLLPWQTPGFAG